MRRRVRFAETVAVTLLFGVGTAGAQVLDHQALLQRESFWDNRDFAWYSQNIPFFDCPDRELTTTYYYRWELLTKHLTYGSPNSGYSFTEFIDRPFWSGAYGSISCPAGLQLYEARWLRDPKIARDYVRYWFRTPGAQPRRYSTWLVDAAWAVHQIHPDSAFLTGLLPDFVRNFEEWEKSRFDPDVGLFWQSGHDDGMEYNINSRQTRDPNAGAQGYRPPLNSYMIADARAIGKIARLKGEPTLAKTFEDKQQTLHARMNELLWDPQRRFYFHRFRNDEISNGVAVKKGTLTHQSGKFAGSSFGRELHGYVPWQFGLAPADRVDMWNVLFDDEGFRAPFGPTTVERRDPMFALNMTCCWWSGQSWPYATAQTLQGLANVLHTDPKTTFSKADYYTTLLTYAKTHRKNGRPYIAEACNPFTGSWEGHDSYNHSEHYFHSSFCDLVISGLVGLRLGDGDSIVVHPLAPDDWEYFAIDNLRVKGHDIAVLYDKTGSHFGRGKGLMLFIDGRLRASCGTMGPIQVDDVKSIETPTPARRRVNFAVNNDGLYYPRIKATCSNSKLSLRKLIDGNSWYHQHPPNRWTFEGTTNKYDSITIDFGVARTIDEAKLYVLDDVDATAPPEGFSIECFQQGRWIPVAVLELTPVRPEGRRANRVRFTPTTTNTFRLTFIHRADAPTGLTEIELWGDAEGWVSAAPLPQGNLAAAPGVKSAASFTSRFDRVEEACDGVVNFNPEPRNRWTSYESPNKSDWVEFDFGSPRTFSRVELAIFSDGRGVRAPKSYWIEIFSEGDWKRVPGQATSPSSPNGGEFNEVRFPPTTASKARVVFEHASPGRSGVSEVFIWKD